MISDEAKAAIVAHAIEDYPHECCGFVLVSAAGKERVIRCVNSHSDPKNYVRVSAEEQARVELLGEKLAFYHSHPDVAATVTDADKASCEAMDLPWVVYAHPLGLWDYYSPEGWQAPLVGRTFVHGVHDCYSAVRDHYSQVCGINLLDFEREDDWWRHGQNLYLDNVTKAGFVQVQDLKKNDVILIQVSSDVVNHAAVYLGENIILHHVYGRLSCRAPYGGFWLKNTRMVIRHSSLC
jgi:proteasome lid subunit RPN8/RPN11